MAGCLSQNYKGSIHVPKSDSKKKYSPKTKIDLFQVRGLAKAEKDIIDYVYLNFPTSDVAILFFTLQSWLEFFQEVPPVKASQSLGTSILRKLNNIMNGFSSEIEIKNLNSKKEEEDQEVTFIQQVQNKYDLAFLT